MIKSVDWAGRTCRLEYETGGVVPVGAEHKTWTGETFQILGGSAPHKSSSTGRVHCVIPEMKATSHGCEFFPSVFGMKWVPEEGR